MFWFQEDIKTLCIHVVENFSKVLDDIDYVQTFKSLKMRYDQHLDKLKDRPSLDRYGPNLGLEIPSSWFEVLINYFYILILSFLFFGKISVPSILRNTRYRRDQRQLEEEEEMWFNEEEDFEEDSVVPGPDADILTKKLDSDLNSTLGRRPSMDSVWIQQCAITVCYHCK